MSDAARAKDDAAVVEILKERDWSRVALAREVHALREQTAALRVALFDLVEYVKARRLDVEAAPMHAARALLADP